MARAKRCVCGHWVTAHRRTIMSVPIVQEAPLQYPASLYHPISQRYAHSSYERDECRHCGCASIESSDVA